MCESVRGVKKRNTCTSKLQSFSCAFKHLLNKIVKLSVNRYVICLILFGQTFKIRIKCFDPAGNHYATFATHIFLLSN